MNKDVFSIFEEILMTRNFSHDSVFISCSYIGVNCMDTILPAQLLRQLHCLPVHQRFSFKVAAMIHQSLSGNLPSYLADNCRLIADARE